MFNYGICNETYQGWTWEATCRSIAECGYTYVEAAPFTLADDVRSVSAMQRRELRETAEACGLKVIGLHWLLVSPKGLSITSDDPDVRKETSKYLGALAEFCSDLGGVTMVLGSPAQRRLPSIANLAGRDSQTVAIERLTAVLDPVLHRSEAVGVTLCLEPLPAPEADFILTLEDAAAFVTARNHPNLRSMLDIKSASSEKTSIPSLIEKYSTIIHHVHANDSNRRGPGFGETDFVPILGALRNAEYSGPISVEVFDYTPDPVTIARESIAYLRECEQQLESK